MRLGGVVRISNTNEDIFCREALGRAVATASNVQVRQKVYQGSSERWKRYEPYLNGALDCLGVDKQ